MLGSWEGSFVVEYLFGIIYVLGWMISVINKSEIKVENW